MSASLYARDVTDITGLAVLRTRGAPARVSEAVDEVRRKLVSRELRGARKSDPGEDSLRRHPQVEPGRSDVLRLRKINPLFMEP